MANGRLPAWVSALANAPEDDEPLSPEEQIALDTAKAKLRAKGVTLMKQSEIERAACELEST